MSPSILSIFIFFLSPFLAFSALPPTRVPPDLASLICPDHPRIFFNADTFPAVKARALGPGASADRPADRLVDRPASRPAGRG